MPPSAMARSVTSAMSRGSAAPVRACSRRRNSSSLGRGNFGASPKPPRRGSNDDGELSHRATRGRRHRERRRGPPSSACSEGVPMIVAADCSTFVALLAPDARDLFEDLDEARSSPSCRRREVGAAVERLEGRRQPDAHRPPAGSGRGLDERHVDAVDVRALLAIDLDRHEVRD